MKGLLLALVAGAGCQAPVVADAVGVEVLPATAEIPENLLRFYVRFPGPMQRGDAEEEIVLLDAGGAPIDGAFLRIGQELWSADMHTLTLFVDPGRLKQGVEPNRSVGPPLRAGEVVTLRVGSGLRDASGAALNEARLASYTVAGPDRAGPEPARWRLSTPTRRTLDALELVLEAPIDPVMAPRYLRVQGEDAAARPGIWTVSGSGLELRFTPAAPWSEGALWLAVHPGLEDLAGNRVNTAFDMEPGTVAGLSRSEPVRVPLRLRAPPG